MAVDIPTYSPESPTNQVILKTHTNTRGEHMDAVGEKLKSE